MTKVRNLTELTEPADSDLLYAVDFSEGSNAGRKLTIQTLREFLIGGGVDTNTYLQYTNAADATNATTTFTAISLATDRFSRAGVYFDKPSATQLRTLYAGHVRLNYKVSFYAANNDRGLDIRVEKNGVAINGTTSRAVARGSVNEQNSTSLEFITPCSNGDLYTLTFRSILGDSLITIPIDAALFKAELYRVN